jgi:hypothetical protein
MRKLVLTTLFVLVSLLVAGVALAAPPAQINACYSWNIQGEWQYRASAGGYGTLSYKQDALGNLSGGWHNVANGASGDIEGSITGSTVNWNSPGSSESFVATVTSDGKKIAGTFTSPGASGTWEATGSAVCILQQPEPDPGTAHVTINWGNYVFRFNLKTSSAAQSSAGSPQAPDQTTAPPIITAPGNVIETVTVTFFGNNLPSTLQVGLRVNNGPRTPLATLRQISTFTGGAVYQGQVIVPAVQSSIGQITVNTEVLVDPFNPNIEYLIKTVQNPLIDPSGYIYDKTTDKRIQDAMVTLYYKVGGKWAFWNADQYGQTNPQVSDDVGHYGWDVPTGDYQVRVARKCYSDAQSPSVHIPPPRTDVNIPLTSAGCTGLSFTDLQLSDEAGVLKSGFDAGDQIAQHLFITNTTGGDVTVPISWTVKDPDGNPVQSLSGSGSYNVAPFGTQVDLFGKIPLNARTGLYSFNASLTHDGQTSFTGTSFQVTETDLTAVFLPAVMRSQVAAKTGFNGRVTYNNAPASGIQVDLRFYDGGSWSTAKSANTGSDGRFTISGVPGLSSGQKYYLRFGPNTSNKNYLYSWYCPTLTSYAAGDAVADCDFDIANITLGEPDSGATVKLPVTFNWDKRGVSGDSYQWELFEVDDDNYWDSQLLGDVSSFTLSNLPSGVSNGPHYGWMILANQGDDSYGSSFYYHSVYFSSSSAAGLFNREKRQIIELEEYMK